MSEFVDFLVMHGEEDLAGLYGGGVVGLRGDAGAAAGDGQLLAVCDAKLLSVFGMDFEITLLRIKLAENFGFVGPRLSMPLATGSASR